MMKKTGTEKANNKDFQLWQQHNHPIEFSTNEIMQQCVDYIHENLVKAGFAETPSGWLVSSARDYEGETGAYPNIFHGLEMFYGLNERWS